MLGIFQHKKEEKNKLILKSLLAGAKTTSQIAEYIYFNRKSAIKPQKPNKNAIKSEVSQISRKGSRLEELETKHYIKKDNNLYQLTMKGMPVALTLFNDITKAWPYIINKSTESTIQNAVNELDDIPYLEQIPFAKDLFNKEKIAEALGAGLSPRFLEMLRDCTNEFINRGVDIDQMDEQEFTTLLMSQVIARYFKTEMFERMSEIFQRCSNQREKKE